MVISISQGAMRINTPWMGFPSGSDGKASARNEGDPGSIPGLGRSPGEENGNPLQYSCLENSTDGGAWWATVNGVAKSQTQLSDFTMKIKPDTMHIILNMEVVYNPVNILAVTIFIVSITISIIIIINFTMARIFLDVISHLLAKQLAVMVKMGKRKY